MKILLITKILIIGLLSFSFLTNAEDKNLKDIEVKNNKVSISEGEQPQSETGLHTTSAYFNKLAAEEKSGFDPYVMTPHKMTYILPFSYTNNVNRDIYKEIGEWDKELQSLELKFQFSLKVPLTEDDIFVEGDRFDFAFTLKAWWQLYNQELSRPFRETNYEPEFFYTAPLTWRPYDGDTNVVFGFEHQSNGRTQLSSRSWNRFYSTFTFAKNNYAISLRPWWIVPEGSKETTLEEAANDNIDIKDYMGNFDLTVLYKWHSLEFSFVGRRNFKENNGGMELAMTFPLSGKLKGYFQFTSGYGESLIDYNHSQETVGIGIALTEMF